VVAARSSKRCARFLRLITLSIAWKIHGVVVGRIFLSPAAPRGRPWMWASRHNGEIRRAAHRYEPAREAAMAAF
jgi:hypothetical protein